jgi:hypothetical protein
VVVVVLGDGGLAIPGVVVPVCGVDLVWAKIVPTHTTSSVDAARERKGLRMLLLQAFTNWPYRISMLGSILETAAAAQPSQLQIAKKNAEITSRRFRRFEVGFELRFGRI